jgi:hypothetical protein
MLTITVRSPSKSRTRPTYHLNVGDGFLGVTSAPFHGGARLLLDAGYGPDTPFQTTVADSPMPSLRGVIGKAAKLTVNDEDVGGLVVRRYRPFSTERLMAA